MDTNKENRDQILALKAQLQKIENNCESILNRNVMETNSLNFADMADKVSEDTLFRLKIINKLFNL